MSTVRVSLHQGLCSAGLGLASLHKLGFRAHPQPWPLPGWPAPLGPALLQGWRSEEGQVTTPNLSSPGPTDPGTSWVGHLQVPVGLTEVGPQESGTPSSEHGRRAVLPPQVGVGEEPCRLGGQRFA